MANPFVHVELNTQDLPKAKEFYGMLFAWNLEDVDMGVVEAEDVSASRRGVLPPAAAPS